MPQFDIPNDNVAEVTLIGTGGGYGESIIIHLGNQNWIVVDSCINPTTNESLPLEYLRQINVDLSNVKLIVCTHWHDDHILGLSQLLENCPNAQFSFARAHDRKKFLRLLSFDYEKLQKESSLSSTKEFNTCINIITNRQGQLKEASPDRLLLSIQLNDNLFSQVYSLSPSDFTMQQFDIEISTLITEYGVSNKKLIIPSPNAKSVVLFLKLGNHRSLLGADLEVSSNDREGWQSILLNSQAIDKKSSLFKISHHGSENGYHPDIWINLLSSHPIATLTPWNKNGKLPDPNMLQTFSSHTNNLFMTTPVINQKPKKRDKTIEKTINKFNKSLREVKFNKGIIRSRISLLSNEDDRWQVDLMGNSFHVNPELE